AHERQTTGRREGGKIGVRFLGVFVTSQRDASGSDSTSIGRSSHQILPAFPSSCRFWLDSFKASRRARPRDGTRASASKAAVWQPTFSSPGLAKGETKSPHCGLNDDGVRFVSQSRDKGGKTRTCARDFEGRARARSLAPGT